MTNEFTREVRYVVLKNADITQCLTVNELIELRRIQAKVTEHRAKTGKPRLECVVVESDWPEYEPTWKAIEARVTGAQPASSAQDDVMREHVMDAVANALGDAYDCMRVWSAWGYGTMGSDDFRLVANDPDRLHEIAEAAIQAVFAAAPKPEVK